MIIHENKVSVEDYDKNLILEFEDKLYLPEQIIFFDLEHYVYKKPKCIGVFGVCEYSKKKRAILVTQYMIEDKDESIDILYLARNYFMKKKQEGKNAIVTFSGNNDFTVINYLFNKYGIEYDFEKEFISIDIQKEYEKSKSSSIGLKKLEKIFDIIREGEVMSGSNLAKTFQKVMKDKSYFKRMPKEKIQKIILYNEQDVVNLYYIYVNWYKYIFDEEYIDEDITENTSEDKEIHSLKDLQEDELVDIYNKSEEIDIKD